MTSSLSRLQLILCGGLVALGLGSAAYGIFAVGDRQHLWSGTFTVHVGFERIQGTSVGTAVRIRGLDAGTVTSIDLPTESRTDAPLVLRIELDPRCAKLLFADATAQIRSEGMVGGRVIELDPGTPERGPLANGSIIASKPARDLNDVIDQATVLVDNVKNGQGSLGKLLNDDKAYHEFAGTLEQTKQLMQRSQEAVASIQQDADAIKKLPLVRGYVEDSTSMLVRHTGERYRQVFSSEELFEPRRAVLTEAGQAKLRGLAEWLTSNRQKNSDVVVAAFADPKKEPNNQVAHTLTVRQSEVAAQYLKDEAAAHKLGWWSRRTVTAVGMGIKPTPVQETEALPPARLEVIVFVP